MAKELANSGAKFIHGAVKRNIDPQTEWIKWLSYIPDFQKTRIQQLESKTVREISLEELEEIYQYRYQKKWQIYSNYMVQIIFLKLNI